jgi:hypothetical protein
VNYGKSNLSRRKKQISSKKKRKKKRVGVRFFKALIICFLLLIVIGAAGIGIYVKKVIDNTPEVTAKDIMPQGYTTNIVDSNGTLLEQLKDSDSNRVYKKYDEISPYMGKAFVAIEDERFYKHNGIDIQGIIRAGVNGVAHGFHFTEGASTLTQQLIKNNVFPNFINESKYQRIERKIQEQYLALKIEKEMSKEEILEAYMNTINLGQGCLGVQTAGKPILEVIRGRELTNVLVIVTRYFGGTLLGTGGLVRAYTAATLEGLKNSESIARIHGVKLGIETNYTDLGKIQYLIANRNLDQLEPVYTDKVEMTVFVPTDEMGSLRAELMEGTNGQVVLDEETTCWFARTEDGIKIFDEE